VRVFLTGASGFLGRHLMGALVARGDQCVGLSRSPRAETPGVRWVRGDPTVAGSWQHEVSGTDAVINLVGEVIVDPPRRWTAARKRRLVDSRVHGTEQVVAAIRTAAHPPAALLNASGVGYYGASGDTVVDETASAGTDFLARLGLAWEAAARAAQPGTRVTLLRSGVVLGADGGALPRLALPFRLGLGGPWGDGRQWWPWIHINDWVALTLFAVDHPLEGAVNLVAPESVTVNTFAAALGRALHRPAALRVPAFALRVGLGEGAAALLDGQRAVPRVALDAGYQFRFPTLAAALRDLFDR
jgi:uncharacterized protein